MHFSFRGRQFDVIGVSDEDHIYKQIVATSSFYEIDLLDYMSSIIEYLGTGGSIAIDIGANIGNHSVYFGSFLADHVISVEPNPAVLPILERNLKQNLNNYSVVRCALGAARGIGRMVIPELAANNIGMASIEPFPPGDSGSGPIQITTLDSLLEEYEESAGAGRRISLIKIDVEGMELAVLKGAMNTIEKHRPHIFLEGSAPEEHRRHREFLGQFGYSTVSCWAATPVYHFAHTPPESLKRLARWLKVKYLLKKARARIFAELGKVFQSPWWED